VITGFAILSFYSVVAGWTLGFLVKAGMGQFSAPMDAEQSEAVFMSLISSPSLAIGLAGAFLVATGLVVRGGIRSGIERAAKILMPFFLVLLVGLAIRAITLPGAGEGLRFLFVPDFSKITLDVVMNALGQALFSLSLGMGAMITYGSYLARTERLPGAAVAVAFSDTGIALLAGLIIFPALFAAGGDPAGGAGLVFVVLPTIFGQLPAGFLFSIAFYALLTIAALTSTVSLLEVVVSYFVDQRHWKREAATWIVVLGCFLLAVPSAIWPVAANGGKSFLDWQSIIFGNYALATGALLICLFVGWRWGIPAALEEIARGGQRLPAAGMWSFLVRFVCPIGVAGIIVYTIVTGNYH
jgi:NSS family neurotransmitter:Na+ symporter